MALPNSQPSGSSTFTKTEVITVGDALGVGNKAGALTLPEMLTTVAGAGSNSAVAASAAGAMIGPLTVVLAVFTAFTIVQIAINILKPIVKMILNIGGMWTNPAEIGELLADIVMTIMQFLIGLAPILLALLVTIFLSIPIGVKFITKTMMANAQNAVAGAKSNLLQQTNSAIDATNVNNSNADAGLAFAAAFENIGGEPSVVIADENSLPDTAPDGMSVLAGNTLFIYSGDTGQWEIVNGDYLAALLEGAPDEIVDTVEDLKANCPDGTYAINSGTYYIADTQTWVDIDSTVIRYDTREDFPDEATNFDLAEDVETTSLYKYYQGVWYEQTVKEGTPTLVVDGYLMKVKENGKTYKAVGECDLQPLEPRAVDGKTNFNNFYNLDKNINEQLEALICTSDSTIDTTTITYDSDFREAFKTEIRNYKNKLLRDARAAYENEIIDPRNIDGWDEMTQDQRDELASVIEGLMTAARSIEGLTLEAILDKHFFSEDGYVRPIEDDEESCQVCQALFDDYAQAVSDKINVLIEQQIADAKNDLKTVDPCDSYSTKVKAGEAFFIVVNEEIEKKKELAKQIEEDLVALGVAQDLVNNNKVLLLDEMRDAVLAKKISASCYKDHIEDVNYINLQLDLIDQFNTMETTIQTDAYATIDGTAVTNTTEMETLVNTIITDLKTDIDNYSIVSNVIYKTNFDNSIDVLIRKFESCIGAESENALASVGLEVTINDVPDTTTVTNVKKELELILDGLVEKLMVEVNKVIVDKVIDCKSCKSSNQLIYDIETYITNQIDINKEDLKNNIDEVIGDDSLDWSVLVGNDIAPKNFLKQKIYDVLKDFSAFFEIDNKIMFYLKLEQEELFDNVEDALTPTVWS